MKSIYRKNGSLRWGRMDAVQRLFYALWQIGESFAFRKHMLDCGLREISKEEAALL